MVGTVRTTATVLSLASAPLKTPWMNATISPQCGTPMTITFAMSIAVVAVLAPTMNSLRPTMWQVVTVAKITASTALESPRIKPRIFYFCLKKHLTSAPGCGIIIVGRAGPGRRPGTEFPIGTPYGKILREKVSPRICTQSPENPNPPIGPPYADRVYFKFPIGPHIWPHCGPKIGFDLPREQIKTPLHMPLACL